MVVVWLVIILVRLAVGLISVQAEIVRIVILTKMIYGVHIERVDVVLTLVL